MKHNEIMTKNVPNKFEGHYTGEMKFGFAMSRIS